MHTAALHWSSLCVSCMLLVCIYFACTASATKVLAVIAHAATQHVSWLSTKSLQSLILHWQYPTSMKRTIVVCKCRFFCSCAYLGGRSSLQHNLQMCGQAEHVANIEYEGGAAFRHEYLVFLDFLAFHYLNRKLSSHHCSTGMLHHP